MNLNTTSKLLVVIDDEPDILGNLTEVFELYEFSCRAFTRAEEFLYDLASNASFYNRPFVIVSDVKMPGIGGLGLLDALNGKSNAPIIFVSGNSGIDDVIKSFRRGIDNFVTKPYEVEELRQIIDLAFCNYTTRLSHKSLKIDVLRKYKLLTSRERAVAQGIRKGLKNREIAENLFITERTVKMHRARINEKMETQRLSDLIRMLDVVESEVGIN